jgi:hypothetical protein
MQSAVITYTGITEAPQHPHLSHTERENELETA